MRRNGQGFLLRLAGSFPQQNQFFQKQLKGGEARGIQTKIQGMRDGKFPLHRRMGDSKDEAEKKGIQRTPVAIDNLVQAEANRAPGDFDIRNAVGSHVVAVRPHSQRRQDEGHTPKKDSRTTLGLRISRRKAILLILWRTSQKLHSSSAEKIQSQPPRRLCQDFYLYW